MSDLRAGFRLGDRRVLPRENRIAGPEGDARVEPKVMDVLVCLARHAGEVVPREAFYSEVWCDSIVTDHALTHCISELRQQLGDDPSAPRFIATVPKRGYRLVAPVEPLGSGPARDGDKDATREGGPWPPRRAWPGLAAVVLVLTVWVGSVTWWLGGGGGHRADAPVAVTVLPFDDLGGDHDLAYLRLALPDEITTVLARAPGLAVRPFDPQAPDEPLRVGRATGAGTVVTGHYYAEGDDRLTVTLQAVDLERETLAWSARVSTPRDDVLTLRDRIDRQVRTGLLPALGAAAPLTAGARPESAEAYRLYLKGLAISRRPGPNRHGIELLERAVELDPEFAPAWSALAFRHHREGAYGEGGDAALERARAAAERALEIDPRLMPAAQRLVSLEAEAGALVSAYRRAAALVHRREDSAQAHFALAYVLRYGGLLDASQRHCDRALALDPYSHEWRSCGFTYLADGELDRAERFIALDPGSYWADLVTILLRLRRGDEAGALRVARGLPPQGADRRFLTACLGGRRGPAVDTAAADLVRRWKRLQDPEPGYWVGSELAHCGRRNEALELLAHAVDGGYCAYPAVDRDPAWAGLRDDPELQAIRERGRACRERFRSAVGTVP